MRKKGFTLLELVIVIAIIGIFTAIAVPSIGSAVENSKYLKDIQNADLMSKALDASHISFISSRDIDMEEVCAAVVGAGFSVRTESEDAAFVYVRETGTIYVTKELLQGNYDSRYQKYAQVTFQDANGKTLYGYVLDPESKLISSGSGNGDGGLQSISLSDRFLYLERCVEKDTESGDLTEKESLYEISADFKGLSDEEAEKIVWRSSNEKAVAVKPIAEDPTHAELSVVGAGTAVITVSVEGYGCYAQCVVCTDIRPTGVEIEDILTGDGDYIVSVEGDGLVYFDKEEKRPVLPVGTKFTLSAKGIYTYKDAETNEEILLMPSTEEVEFGVLDDGVIEIDPETGEAEIVGTGETVITIKSKYKSSDPAASDVEEEIIKQIKISGYFPLDSVELQASASEDDPINLIFAKNSETEERQNAVLVELELSMEEDSPYIPVDLAFTADFGAEVSLASVRWKCERNGAAYDNLIPEGYSDGLSSPVKITAAALKISEPGVYIVALEVTDRADKTITESYTVVVTDGFQKNTSVKTEKDGEPQKETVMIEEEERQYDIIKAGFGPSNIFYIENQTFIEEQDLLPVLKIKAASIKYSDVIAMRGMEMLEADQLNEAQLSGMTVSLQNFEGTAYSLFFQISTYGDGINSIGTGNKLLLSTELTLSYAVDEDTAFDFVVPLKFIVEMQ